MIWDIHCDESSQTKHRYIVIGTLYGRADRTAKVVAAIERAIGPPHPGTSELKWTKIRPRNVDMYKSLISALHPLMKDGTVRFHCIVVDSWRCNHRDYNEGDKDLGFTKYTFTLLYKFARIHALPSSSPHFNVHLDKRETRHSPDVTRITLNHKDASEHGRGYEAYKLVHFVDSKTSRMIQAADVFTGVVAAAWNLTHTSARKREMIDFIEKKWFFPLSEGTAKHISLRGIDIWPLDWDAKAKKAAQRPV